MSAVTFSNARRWVASRASILTAGVAASQLLVMAMLGMIRPDLISVPANWGVLLASATILGLALINHTDRASPVAENRDKSDSKCTLAQQVHSQKMESIGQLAAGIAHEINTPTQFVGDNLNFLEDSFAPIESLLRSLDAWVQDDSVNESPRAMRQQLNDQMRASSVRDLLDEIPLAIRESREGIDRIATITRAMKEFSHPGSEHFAAVDLRKSVENAVLVCRTEWKYVAEVRTEFAADLPEVEGLAGELNQVLLNLIVNAAQAIGDDVSRYPEGKGLITLRVRPLVEAVEIEVADNGPGIPEAIRQRVFDPFFTTKQVGKGTGQGLAIAHSVVVDKHHGSLSLESEPGAGTTFTIRLPIRQPAASVLV